jgi:protein O-GlcNAc transferase
MASPDSRIAQALRLLEANQVAAAEQLYRQILHTEPNHADAHFLLGSLLHRTNRSEQAIQHLRRAIALSPQRTDFLPPLLEALCALNRRPEAIAEARAMVAAQPDSADAHHILAQLLLNTGDAAAAVPHARRVVKLLPDVALVHRTLAAALAASNQPNEALAVMDRAITLDPNSIDAIVDRGTLLQNLGRFDEAIAAYEAALRIAPHHINALHNMAMCYAQRGRAIDAVRNLQIVTQLAPTHASAWNNLGVALQELNRMEEAIAAFTQAVQIQSTFAEALGNLANCNGMIGRHEPAIAAYRQSLHLRGDASTFSNLLLELLHMPGTDEAAIYEEHLEYDRQFAEPLRGKIQPHLNDWTPDRPLRIGYVSPDFREHPVAYFIEPIFASHDQRWFEVFCYSIGVRKRDAMSERLRAHGSHWYDAAALSDDDLAEMIRLHRIDVLVDLAAHTAENRLLVFARKPAPVQVTDLGYPATTGLATMDYRLTDATADPPDAPRTFCREELIRLPGPFFVYRTSSEAPLDATLPADRTGAITFGSFNKLGKINEPTLAAWASILAQTPGSRLLIKASVLADATTRRSIGDFFIARGISADRLDLRPWVAAAERRTILGSVDLALDTFPYNGHTTTCEALSMGTPTITRAGHTFRSRVGASANHYLGLPELITRSDEEYVRVAVELASNRQRLRDVRAPLREAIKTSPIFDAIGFTRSLEQAYHAMWERACRNS